MKRPLAGKIIVLAILVPVAVKAYQKVRALGPPTVEPQEVYAARSASGQRIDHTRFDALLRKHVRDGRVDYAALKGSESNLDAYLQSLATIDAAMYGRDELLALYINAYNAATLKLILDYLPGIKSIRDIPATKRWKAKRWTVAGELLSLDALEHEVLRARFKEPRIHFAIVCASIGCPDLRQEAFVGPRVDEQLQDQAQRFHRDERHLRWDPATGTLHLSAIYDWFPEDFRRDGGTIVDFVVRFVEPEITQALTRRGDDITIKHLDYDWNLNAV